ncbi:MAG TPA: NADH-quinone oxidoreductase subunit H, partial [Acidimicrobiales bacterium]
MNGTTPVAMTFHRGAPTDPNRSYPLLGSVRASAQMVSYEAAMALSVMAVILVTGSLTTNAIVNWQAGAGP